jgi:hypothetical protein
VAAGRGGHLVNLFTCSRSVRARLPLPADEDARIRAVTHLRDAEDRRFADLSGLTRHDLGLIDPPARGVRPFDTRGIGADVAELSRPLLDLLTTIRVSEPGRPLRLFCPMAIGAHRNHLATLLAVREHLDRLSGFCNVLLYEDLPYASDPVQRQAGVSRALQLFEGRVRERIVLKLSEASFEQKMARVALYASQHPGLPEPARFSPAAPGVQGPHEAWWRPGRATSFARPGRASEP